MKEMRAVGGYDIFLKRIVTDCDANGCAVVEKI
jgi:hypothetical protein